MGPLQKDLRVHEEPLALYLHIPFCLKKCPYCDFNSYGVGVRPTPLGAGIPEAGYSSCLVKELSVADKGAGPVATIYIGGGTPSLFSPECFSRLLSKIGGILPIGRDAEITVEANSGTVTREKLRGYREAGINRLSLGVQSLSDAELEALGRMHDASDALRAFEDARRAGFENIGIDLMFGVPGQGVKGFEESLRKAISLCPEHVSLYSLTLEPGTEFFSRYGGAARSPLLPSEEEEKEMYLMAVDLLGEGGYGQYEVSNFSRPGFECRHNMAYWQGLDYMGIGAGAHSYASSPGWGRRWWNEDLPDVYMQRVSTEGAAVAGEEFLTKEMAMTEALFTGLRLMKGIDRQRFMERFDVRPEDALSRKGLTQDGLLSGDDRTLKLTRKGLLFLDEIF